MPRLVVYCTYEIQIDNPLHRSLGDLTSEEVLKMVKDALPKPFVPETVRVSSAPIPRQSPIWVGRCHTDTKKECLWKLMRGLWE